MTEYIYVCTLAQIRYFHMIIKICILVLIGDQGFLNAYYAGFPSARVFDPNVSPEEQDSRLVAEMERLSTLYNADVGLYMLANKVGSTFDFLFFLDVSLAMLVLNLLILYHRAS